MPQVSSVSRLKMGSATSRFGGLGNKSSKGTGKNRLCPLAGVQQNALCLPNLTFEISRRLFAFISLYYLLRSTRLAFTKIAGRQFNFDTRSTMIIVTTRQSLASRSLGTKSVSNSASIKCSRSTHRPIAVFPIRRLFIRATILLLILDIKPGQCIC